MKIRVESFYEGWVRFTCELGSGEARWCGKEPEPFREYFVELGLETPVEVKPAMAKIPLLDADRERVLLRGFVERADGDLWSVRIGEARLDLEAGLLVDVGQWVAIRASALSLFDERTSEQVKR